jgi:small conductance mechanosensitive channel
MEKTATTAVHTIDQIRIKIIDFATDYGLQIIGALIILTIGAIIAWWLGRILGRWLEKKKIEPPLCMLATRVARLLVFGFACVAALEKLHYDTKSIIAAIGVAGVGIGLAMQGVLGNLVAGLTIIFTKPFRVGEYIEIASVQGQVTHMELFSTMLVHPDRSRIMVPNRKIVGEILHNYGQIRQLDLNVGVAYGTDVDSALKIVRDILAANPRVLKEPAPVVGIAAFGDSSIQIMVKPWTAVADYNNNKMQLEINEAILHQFRANKIEIPFPQREVRLINN